MTQVGARQVTKFQQIKPILIESTFYWEIQNFADIREPSIESARIAIPDVDAEYWITILPKVVDGVVDISEKNKTVFSFSFKMLSDAWKSNKYEFEVTCTTPDRNFPINRKKVFQFPSQPVDNEVITTTEYIRSTIVSSSYSKLNSYILDVKVTLRYLGCSMIRSKIYDPYAVNNEILSNVRGLQNDPTFSDFSFFVKDKEFKVHKNILAAASPVFMKMFTTEMEESRTNICRVEHIEPEVFGKLLECIYKGKLPDDFSSYARELYAVADYYGIGRLKELCRTEVYERLAASNAVETFSWACRYNLDDLRIDAWEIVKRLDRYFIKSA